MKKRLSTAFLLIYALVFLVSCFALSAPGGNIAFYIVMVILSIFPIIFGNKILRIIGVGAIALALLLTYIEYERGKTFRKRIEEKYQKLEKEKK